LGQNFLIDHNILEKIMRVADIEDADTVIEIGAGFGVLTGELAKRAKKVIAVEFDRKLAEFLRDNYKENARVEVIEGDILSLFIDRQGLLRRSAPRNDKVRIADIRVPEQYKIVANLPYSIATAVIKKFFSCTPKPAMMVVLVQEEVARRIVAVPPDMSVLAVSVQFYAFPEIIFHVPQNCFWPVPHVGSSVLRIPLRSTPLCEERDFFRIVKIGFSAKRKQLKNNLKAGLKISEDALFAAFQHAGIAKNARAQEIPLETWHALTRELGCLM
jgi:16S rRNA (adenine1518-N6/adenine1519-N6)-dimethyltransferase